MYFMLLRESSTRTSVERTHDVPGGRHRPLKTIILTISVEYVYTYVCVSTGWVARAISVSVDRSTLRGSSGHDCVKARA